MAVDNGHHQNKTDVVYVGITHSDTLIHSHLPFAQIITISPMYMYAVLMYIIGTDIESKRNQISLEFGYTNIVYDSVAIPISTSSSLESSSSSSFKLKKSILSKTTTITTTDDSPPPAGPAVPAKILSLRMNDVGLSVRSKYNLNRNDLIILYVARLTTVKLPYVFSDVIIRLANIYNDDNNKSKYNTFHVFVLGDGPEGSKLKEIINNSIANKYVTFMGMINDDKIMHEFYCSADVIFLPTSMEGIYTSILSFYPPVFIFLHTRDIPIYILTHFI